MKHRLRPNFLTPFFVLCVLAAMANWHSAAAHPMGNFSINHLSRLSARADRITVDYRLDMAEIPALAERNEIDRDDDGEISSAEQNTYKNGKAATLSRNLKLSVNGKASKLRVLGMQMQWSRGAGGLSTLRLILSCVALLPKGASGARRAEYSDTNFARRAGWKEIVVVAGQGVTLQKSNVPSGDVTRGLTVYPSGATPPQRTTASFQFALKKKPAAPARRAQIKTASFQLLGTDFNSSESTLFFAKTQRTAPSFQFIGSGDNAPPASSTDDAAPTSSNTNTPQDAFTQSIAEHKLTPRVMLIGILLAFFFGASHALSPGHGKTMVAAYLVGERGTWRHALLLGIVVTTTHTLGVFLLGMAVWFASEKVEPDRLYPILSTASGLMIFGVGLWLLQQRLAKLSKGDQGHGHHHHDHSHGEHDHAEHSHADHEHGEHDHAHGEHGHSHVPQGPITLRALIALGISGGLVPCPSALIVLLSAIALHRIAYGLVLIIVFSLGLASVLIAIGCAVVSAQSWFSRREGFQIPPALSGLVRYLPVISATAVTLIGLMLTWRALGPVAP